MSCVIRVVIVLEVLQNLAHAEGECGLLVVSHHVAHVLVEHKHVYPTLPSMLKGVRHSVYVERDGGCKLALCTADDHMTAVHQQLGCAQFTTILRYSLLESADHGV